jgi:hypothetical protein
MEPRLDEEAGRFPDSPPAAAREYAELGERVAGVLRAAEEAAQGIQEDARRKADGVRRRAETEARAQVENERAKAAADAESIRDAAQAAAGRIAQEGQRRLGELREAGRALEGRFESAVDDLHDLIVQLEAVVHEAAHRSEVTVEAEDADTDPGRALEHDLWPRGEGAERPADAANVHQTRPV